MENLRLDSKGHPIWWAMALFATTIALAVLCSAIFAGAFQRSVPVTLTSDRVGLVMETGAKVKMRGVEVGRVSGIEGGKQPLKLKLEISPDQIAAIPSNVQADIASTTAFGAKYVDLIYPENPSPQSLSAGTVLKSRNVATEVNTVFDNLVGLLDQIDVKKLNSTLTALADGFRGQGERIGEATTATNRLLQAINPRMDTVAADWRSFKGFSDAYIPAAEDILATLQSASTTSTTISRESTNLDSLLLSTIGLGDSGIGLLGPNRDNIINGINVLEPTTSLLLDYNAEYTCTIVGAKLTLDKGGYENLGGNGYGVIQDVGLLAGDDTYRYPENLPEVNAKGGPGGKPGCGSLPDVAKNMPVRSLVTDTGFGTGLDIRPNPGIGFPGWANYFPVTAPTPMPPLIRYPGPPAPGPWIGPAAVGHDYPGAPPYGAPLYGPDGLPLYPGVPPAPATEPTP